MTSQNQKFISALLIFSMIAPVVIFSAPKQAQAQFGGPVTEVGPFGHIMAFLNGNTSVQTTTDTAFTIKNFAKEIGRQILMVFARRALQQMTKSTINWINSGFHGNPLFLENPKSFFRDIAKYEVKTLVDLFGYDSRRYPFGKDFALNTIGAYKRQLADNAQYSLSKVINDPNLLNRYRNDFNVGGWNGFLINTQYPQNNYIGFQMLATEELARRLAGTASNTAGKVRDTLQQGMGFLSPQTCLSNPNYPPATNPYNPPSFKKTPFNPPPWSDSLYEVDANGNFIYDADGKPVPNQARSRYDLYVSNWERTNQVDKENFDKKYTCPKGLVNTTPGSVVGAQIAKALGGAQDQASLAAAMGNSISAILDALMNKFIGSGLNALATKVNPKAPADTWDYYGNTLGSPRDNTNNAWDSGPDEPIVLSDFKKAIDDGIDNTNTELQLMSNESSTDPGITQLLGQIWPKSRELDRCQPGPDIGWQDRMADETTRNSKKFQEKVNDSNGEKVALADLAYKELKFAVNFFKDWINNKMMTELPNSIIYMDAVDEIKDLSQQSDELTDKKRTRTQALARLQSIKASLAVITTQPEPGSSQEKILISLKKQYDATSNAVSSTATIEDTRNELDIAKDKLSNLKKLVIQCGTERIAKGWSTPGKWNSVFSGSEGASSTVDPRYEPASLLASVIAERNKPEYGASPNPAQLSQILINVAAQNSSAGWGVLSKPDGHKCPSSFGDISCDILFHGPSCLIYDVLVAADDGGPATPAWNFAGGIGRSRWRGNGNWTSATTPPCAPVIPSIGPNASGNELALFCSQPIIGGYSHEMFNGPDTTNPKLPMVNAKKVRYSWGFWGTKYADVKLSCSIIYKANVLDYKGNLPGLTTIIEPYEELPDDTGDDGGGGTCDEPADADRHGDQSGIVAQAKASLEAQGTDLSGPCGAFAIVSEAARRMGAGLWSKPTGNNCNGFSVDIIAYPDGYIYDVLVDGGGANTPTWNSATCLPLEPDRYRSP